MRVDESWSDQDIVDELNDIEEGLGRGELVWIDKITKQVDGGEPLRESQRDKAAEILARFDG